MWRSSFFFLLFFVGFCLGQQKDPPEVARCNGKNFRPESKVLYGKSGSASSDSHFFKIEWEMMEDNVHMKFNISGRLPFQLNPLLTTLSLGFSEGPCMPETDVVVIGGANGQPVISERFIPAGSYGEPEIRDGKRNRLIELLSVDGWLSAVFTRSVVVEVDQGVSISESTWWKWAVSQTQIWDENTPLRGHEAAGSFHYNWHGTICSDDRHCNVCDDCCKSYLYGTNACPRCVQESCPEYLGPEGPPRRINCNPRGRPGFGGERGCNTCNACCKDYLGFDYQLCSACHEAECKEPVCIPDEAAGEECTCDECCHPWYNTARDCRNCIGLYQDCHLS